MNFSEEKGKGCMKVNVKNLRELRKEKGATQEIIAKETGLSIKTIYRYERARVKRPEPKTIERLADYYGVVLEVDDIE